MAIARECPSDTAFDIPRNGRLGMSEPRVSARLTFIAELPRCLSKNG